MRLQLPSSGNNHSGAEFKKVKKKLVGYLPKSPGSMSTDYEPNALTTDLKYKFVLNIADLET